MRRDVPITTLRLLLRMANAFAIDFLSISRGERDFSDALILAALMQSRSARLGREPELQWRYAALDTPSPGDFGRPLSMNALAQSLSLPFETVRRRTKRLIAEGACEVVPEGVQLTEALLRSAAHRQALEQTYLTVSALYSRVVRANCLDAMDLPPGDAATAFGPERPVQIVWRAASDYFLRLIEVLPAVATVTQAFVFLEVFRANTIHFSDAVRGGDGAQDFVPDHHRRPVRVMDVSVRLGLPYETVRRNVRQLVEADRVQRVDEGYIVPIASLAQGPALAAGQANFSSLSRMFADLAHTGVLARWDAERGGEIRGVREGA